ncbi:peptidoglycan-binding protein [Streptomyces lydicus]|uniref:peptidoglycan-binding protein n=1 Tax=Streptomyces lydicus TaxID=47763 RepID=UPI0036FDB648
MSLPGDDGSPGEGAGEGGAVREGTGEDGAVGRDRRRAAGEAYRTTGVRRGDHLDDLPGVDAAVHRADTGTGTETETETYKAYGPGSPPSGPEPLPNEPLPIEPLPGGPLPIDRIERLPVSAGTPEPLIPRARQHSGPSSRTFSSATDEPTARTSAAATASSPARRRRGIPAVLVAAGTAVAATAVMIGTDVLSGGRQDRAAPPDGGAPSPTATAPSSDDPAPTDSGTSPHATPSSPAPDATHFGAPKATVKLHRTAEPRPPAPTRAAGTVIDSPSGPGPSTAPAPAPTGPIVLREGSSGPEVAELQERLRQLALYADPADGRYDADVRAAVSRYQQSYRVQGDPDGVYGTRTRASLEARTQEP